ncbi:MAG: right-handed parallel beta-helix repeat-containing protein [Bacteroidota bacterium]
MKRTLPYLLAAFCAFFMACEPEEQRFTFDQNAQLRFSTDTVFFDTIFSTVGSITQRLRVFNDNDNAVNISNISLGRATDSEYTIAINGQKGNAFEDVRLLGQDSMLVLVEVTIDPRDENLPFIVQDSIVFETNNNLQDVKLISFGQDANFLMDSVLTCNTTWTADRPYVIFNSVLVDSLCQLTIEEGTRIFSNTGSFIFVQGTIKVNGQPDGRVLFTNDRQDEDFENAPGQWGGLIFLEGSKDNEIQYADIRNAQIGIRLGAPDDDDIPEVVIGNTRIENMSNTGILTFTSDLYAYNTLVNNCAIAAVANFAGGNYRYEHCTFANFSFDFFRQDPSVVFSDNVVLADNSILEADLNVQVFNTIIWGSLSDELTLSSTGNNDFILSVVNSLIRTTDEGLDINNNILNLDPLFFDPREFDYSLDTLSPAKDSGLDILITNDIEGRERDQLPDIGAFERIEE